MNSRRQKRTSGKATEISDISTDRKKSLLRKRYNKMVVIDLEKRAVLRDLVKRNTKCEHKQIYTQANAISRRMTTAYEEGKITKEQVLELVLEAHNQMTHKGIPKEVVAGEMNKRLDKLQNISDRSVGVTMANVARNGSGIKALGDPASKYSEAYWSEVI